MSEFWSSLTDAERAAFRERSTVRWWRRGELLIREADASLWVAVLLKGRVKISSHDPSGAHALLAICGPGALLGEVAVVDNAPRSASIHALEHVDALVMNVPVFESYLERMPRVQVLVMRTLATRLRDADRKRLEFTAYDSTARVAARLVELAERFGATDAGAIRITLPLSQDDLADWVGSSREAVTRALAALRRQGWIRTGRMSTSILDLESLRVRATRPSVQRGARKAVLSTGPSHVV
ncbi:Crp/Fnr family transcriptional regulator [Phytohabitans aurantiacus]|jgi:CRP/FNR family cyclic AMP-dependent transcriptional regulator|uniref:CarD family transcriptional regulator n=1 Tax=Phytohabitans aurantiacus TaxID=3016789 RepID=A0ABQ5QLR9_9ACTN|nr:Crp/Fnr family transcriptional regulator [Phytohabitans aurantiacus]GLH95289.1 CarD family transcriptional regulator [Phytohabitans aurantiacus]